MVASLLTGGDEREILAELLRPEPLGNGLVPEERLVFCGVSWERYLAADRVLGEDRSSPRCYYLDGELEIMTTSKEHERVKKMLGDLLAIYFEETGIEIAPHGQATLRDALKQAGAEPDESWCIGEEKALPDLVIEVALTSGGVDKLEIYSRFQIPEVWIWERQELKIFGLRDGVYEALARTTFLPKLDLALLARCAAIRSWQEARRVFRAGLVR